MRRISCMFLMIIVMCGMAGCNSNLPPADDLPTDDTANEEVITNMRLTILGATFDVELEDNATVDKLVELLPMTLSMSELNGNEKYYYLNQSLPSDAKRVGEIRAGDIMLWGDDCLVIFYQSFTTNYSYTKIGHIQDATKLEDIVGRGNVLVEWVL